MGNKPIEQMTDADYERLTKIGNKDFIGVERYPHPKGSDHSRIVFDEESSRFIAKSIRVLARIALEVKA